MGNFDSLRWEDQQMIKEKCAEGVNYNLRAQYALSGRSTCRGCRQKITDVNMTLDFYCYKIPFRVHCVLE